MVFKPLQATFKAFDFFIFFETINSKTEKLLLPH